MSIRLKHIDKSFGDQAVLRDVSFSFAGGAVTALTGPSGSGKTTLLNIMLGLVKPERGTVIGLETARVAAVFQEDRLIEHMTALGNVTLVQKKGMPGDAAQILRALGLDPADEKRVSKYSGGMRRRVAIARALAISPNVLFLDEPFKGLDEQAREMAAKAIREYASGAAIVLISHDAADIALMGAVDVLALDAVGTVATGHR